MRLDDFNVSSIKTANMTKNNYGSKQWRFGRIYEKEQAQLTVKFLRRREKILGPRFFKT